MNRIYLFIICLLTITSAKAQIHEIGVFAGGSNYIGDIGPTTYVAPKELAFGLLYKWNISPRHSWRISYTQAKITSNDADASTPGRTQRGFNFENNLKELSLGLEFNFFDFNLHELMPKITPYIFSGVTYFAYDELYFVNGEMKVDKTSSSFAIPMTVGIKSNILTHLVLGIEAGARYTITDNLDGSNPKNSNLAPSKFGNINSNDWYVFTGFTLTYTFGNKPCYCAE